MSEAGPSLPAMQRSVNGHAESCVTQRDQRAYNSYSGLRVTPQFCGLPVSGRKILKSSSVSSRCRRPNRPIIDRTPSSWLVPRPACYLFLAAVFQVAVWELPSYYRARVGDLPAPTDTFFEMFGHRPDGYLIAVVFWLWWPMVVALAYCHHRHREPQAFAVAFLYWFACCWLLAAVVLAFMAMLFVYPLLGLLLAHLERSPDYMWVVPVVSWSLPVAALFFTVACWWRFRGGTDKKT